MVHHGTGFGQEPVWTFAINKRTRPEPPFAEVRQRLTAEGNDSDLIVEQGPLEGDESALSVARACMRQGGGRLLQAPAIDGYLATKRRHAKVGFILFPRASSVPAKAEAD